MVSRSFERRSQPTLDIFLRRKRHGRNRVHWRAGWIVNGKLPSDTFFWAAVASMGVSATLQMRGKPSASVFVGQWAPTLLILGLYNKLVKQHGSDVTDTGA